MSKKPLKSIQEAKNLEEQQLKRQKLDASEKLMNNKSKLSLNLNEIETFLNKPHTHQLDRILTVTTLDELNSSIFYLIKYKNGDIELVPNTILHRHHPQMVIDFLESNLKFSNKENDSLKGVHRNNEKNIDNSGDDDDDYYMFDELSKCIDLNELKVQSAMMKPSTSKQPIDFTELDDFKSSKVSQLIIPGTSKAMNYDQQNVENSNKLNKEELNFINSIIEDDLLASELDENMIDENDDDDNNLQCESENNNQQSLRTPGLNEINETLSMSKCDEFNDDAQRNSQYLSSISPDIMDELIQKSDEKSRSAKDKTLIDSDSDSDDDVLDTADYDQLSLEI